MSAEDWAAFERIALQDYNSKQSSAQVSQVIVVFVSLILMKSMQILILRSVY